MKITKITLQSFRAFDEPFELDLKDGKNLLLHGENGSGKSSIYLALKRFFMECGDDIALHRNQFAPSARSSYVRIHINGPDASGAVHDIDVHWDTNDGHPLPVPTDPAAAATSQEIRSLLIDGARRAGFLDYRMMLRTHLLSGPLPRLNPGPARHNTIYGAECAGLEEQLFDLVALVILDGVRVATAGGTESTIGALMRKVWESRPGSRRNHVLAEANHRANDFNNAFNAKLPELEAKLVEFLNHFEVNTIACISQHPPLLEPSKPEF